MLSQASGPNFITRLRASWAENGIKSSDLSAGICLFKVNNRNTITRCEICLKLTVKISELRHWRRSGIFIVNFEHILQLVLVFLLLVLNM